MTNPTRPKPKLIRDEAYWDQRAEGARLVAEIMRDPVCKHLMAQIADSYEDLAKLTKAFQTAAMQPILGETRKR